MRRRTYAIFTAAVVSTFSLLLLINEQRSLTSDSLLGERLDLASHRLCQALEASHLYLDPPSQIPPRGEAFPRPLLAALSGLGLSQGEPPATLTARWPTTPPAPGPSGPPRTGAHHPQAAVVHCRNPASGHRLLVIPDPGRPEELWITRAGLPPGRQRPWLRLQTGLLLDGAGDRVLVLPDPSSAALPTATTPRQQVDFEGQILELRLASGGPAATSRRSMDQTLAWVLFAFALTLLVLLGFQSKEYSQRRRQLINRLRTDRQTGMLSRLALEQDLQSGQFVPKPSPHTAHTYLLAMVSIRLLERHRAFLQDEEISRLFDSISRVLVSHPQVTREARCYRASENRLAVLFPASSAANDLADPETATEQQDDQRLLESLQERASGAVQAMNQGLIRPDDILITGQRLLPGQVDPSVLRLHGFGEILAAEAGSNTRLLHANDAGHVNQAAALRDALSNLKLADIDLRFQPILLLHNPGQFGLEVLIRFRPPLLQERSTGELIDLAHTLGITHQIDALVIAKVGKLQMELERSELLNKRIEYLSVNISNDSVSSSIRLEQLIGSLRKHRIDSSRICLEFTETPGTGKTSEANPVSTASERLIKELNFRILIDDFGSGLSNYQRICDAWYDTIKLDIDLVSGLGDSLRMQRYLGSFIEAVHGLGKTVVAEGVEDYSDLAAAIRLGTDGLQGYLISRPITWEAIESFLTDSPWSSAQEIEALVNKLKNSDRLLETPADGAGGPSAVPLERFILDKWYELRSFEEFLLLFVNELKSWGLDILRLSLAFLPDEDDIDCSQYVWWNSHPGEITTLRMDRAFLEQEEHLSSPLHHIALRAPFYRQRLGSQRELGFNFLSQLKNQNCSDYLGIRLDSRGISIPVLTIALRGTSSFSDEQIQRICSMSSLLSLLFYTFESERAKRLALLDPLTNLPNRRSFDSFFKALVTAARINNTRFALALLDIDRFKQVNDTMGHAYGDRCLRKVATVLESILRRNSDIVARLGGEEFALILPDTDGNEAMRVGERLRQAVHAARVSSPEEGPGVSLTVSLGIAMWDPSTCSECDVDQLLQLADDCLYEAKRQGRNRVVGRQIAALSSKPGVESEADR